MSLDKLLAHFREQAIYCDLFGSPFTARLIEQMGADLEAGGPVADLIGAWPTNPRADALSLRLAGALHAATLMGADPDLAAVYPAAQSDWRMEHVWPAARALLARERDWVGAFIQSAPQTNETRRTIALLAGLLNFAATHEGEIDTLEIGASAGLNLYWDRFGYETASWRWGGASAVKIDTDWHGPPPPVTAALSVRNRAACDLNPLDINDAAQALRLRAYIWPDQPDRLVRFDGALALARGENVRVERADAADWIEQKLAARAEDRATIVYHSVFLQYPPREVRERIVGSIEAAGARATKAAPLAWVRLEPEALLDGVRDSPRMVADVISWPGGERRVLGHTDGHARAFYAL